MFDYAKISVTLDLNDNDVDCLSEKGKCVRAWEWPWTLKIAREWPRRGRALDAGCGTSRMPLWLKELGYEAYGADNFDYADADPDYVKRAREHFAANDKETTGLTLVEAGLDKLPFPDGHFEVITCVSVMEHIYDPKQPTAHHRHVLELARVLKPGGVLICTYDVHVTPGVNDRVIGFDYRVDIEYLLRNGLKPLVPGYIASRLDMALDDDTLCYPPYIFMKYHYKSRRAFSRQSAFGFALVKE
ncbi:MAG TPA: class I SAM-dependent methyltransferase [Desulfovibrio sp.]|uniref:class I SAM-dependent methyltransferase n=1 Tax=Desulfovibrio TaxID=872 RepID=UPI002BD00ECB|nr:class I SAM-dependent methyltransferase [Desulfovibrio sp.]HMM38717.1 class I SAM-dependent methyltransferase [Desulfovibrio sp.]